MAKLSLTDISSGYLSISTYNANNSLIEAALEKTLSRDGTFPNQMGANIDMNSFRLVNLPDATSNQEPITLAQASLLGSGTGGGVSIPVNQENVGTALYPRTAGEISAGITPTQYWYEPGNVLRYGADPTGVNDSYAAIMNAINSYVGDAWGTYYSSGPTVTFPPGEYKVSQTINLKTAVRLVGETGGQTGGWSATLNFGAGTDGIIVNRFDTNGPTGTTTATTGADNSTIEGLVIAQDGYVSQSANIVDYDSVNSKIIVKKFGAIFEVNDVVQIPDATLAVLAQGTVTAVDATTHALGIDSASSGFTLGETITDGTSAATGVVIHLGSSTKALGLKTVTGTFGVGNTITGGSSAKTGVITSVSTIALQVYTLGTITGTFTDDSSNTGGFNVIVKSGTFGTGIRMRARATVRNCVVRDWGQNGIAVVTGGTTNANVFFIENTSISACNLDGLITSAGDSNAGRISGLNVTSVGGYAVADKSFLGNHYYGCHVASTVAGAYLSAKVNNFSLFSGCYSEGLASSGPFRTPASSIGSLSTVIGGDHGANFDSSEKYYNSGYTLFRGRNFRMGQGIVATTANDTNGLDANGFINETVRYLGQGATPSPITVGVTGNKTSGYGANIAFRMPFGGASAPVKENSEDTVLGGKVGTIWNAYSGTKFQVQLLPESATGTENKIIVTGGGPTRSAKFYPSIVGGVIDSIQIADGGAGYTSAPTLTAQGDWAGFTATTEIFNGEVISVTITNALSGLETTPLVECLSLTKRRMLPGEDNVQGLGSAAKRWDANYSTIIYPGAGTVKWTSGSGTPEGSVSALIGSMYTDTSGSTGTTLYVKETGASTTGWVAK